jgi:hypothetical protein
LIKEHDMSPKGQEHGPIEGGAFAWQIQQLWAKVKLIELSLNRLAGAGGTASDLRLRIELLERGIEELENRT